MAKLYPNKPFLLMLYGYPGAGKTYFARQLGETIQSAHLQADRIRTELFGEPRYDQQENVAVEQLMNYMTEEFLNAGLSVIYDANALQYKQRQALRALANKAHAQSLLLWFQLDQDTAFSRAMNRDRRRADDKFAGEMNRTVFENLVNGMENPRQSEEYIVVSGKHLFETQKSSFFGTLRRLNILSLTGADSEHIAKPGMVNLVPTQGRVDLDRRNISIR